MKRMFESATLKLTAWYLLILVIISLIFSVIIFEISTTEIQSRLQHFQVRLEGRETIVTVPGSDSLRQAQTRMAQTNIFIGLLYMNLVVVGLGGVGSYFLARRSLGPIEAAHEAQSRFTSDASHELRTPLAVMKSEIQVALRDPKVTKAELQALLESNLEEVDSLTQLSETLLNLSRLDFENIPTNQPVALEETLNEVRKALGAGNARLVFKLPKQPVKIEANQTMVKDLLKIVLDNALKYSSPDSVVTVEIADNGRNACITTTNTGPGIASKDIEHIFDRFYRADRSRNHQSQTKGYGLGLSLAKKITDLHDGSIVAKSKPGKMTTFCITLPKVSKNR